MKEDNSNSVYMVKYRTYSAWYKGIVLHRKDGPAVEFAGGDKQWWINGKRLSKQEWFESLSEDLKIKALFNESFVLG